MKLTAAACALAFTGSLLAQPPGFPPDFGPRGGFGGRGGGFGGPGGPGMSREVQLVPLYDKDGDGRLNAEERKAAREAVGNRMRGGFGGGRGGRRGGFGEFGGAQAVISPGPKLTPEEVKRFTNEPLYDPFTLRTLFLDFENEDWALELAAFNDTDVEVPATLTVDGKVYKDIGVHYRGNTSLQMAGEGQKRPLNLSIDFVHQDQRLLGYRTLNLLNAASDPTFLRTLLYMHIARDYIPAPKVNFVRLVINGESWGIYVNAQQFNTDLTRDFFSSTKGARWKVPANPGGGSGGLSYLGDDPTRYKGAYEIKSKDDPKSWEALINLTRVLNQAPIEELEKALEPLLDIDGTLKFLAIDKALINNDGYWVRASDYSLYQDEKGRFHLIPHDANETLRPVEGGGGGRGGRGGPFGGPGGGGGGVALDIFAGANDRNKPLLSRLLMVPSLRARYLSYIQDIAEKWLVWDRVGPLAQRYYALIGPDVEKDTRKLYTTEAFRHGLDQDTAGFGGPMGTSGMSLKSFVEQRRAYLLDALARQEPESRRAAR